MIIKRQFQQNPRVVSHRRLALRAAVASLALATAVLPVAAAGGPGTNTAANLTNIIRPFHIHVPEAVLVGLRQRIAATRWPEKETVADQSQGVQLATMQELARYWATDYDWR